jgi:branched-chain amino acid transport system ATP-binding protein
MLQAEALTGGYGTSARVLDGIDLSLAEGELVALMGRNGMGKTTLVRALTGLLANRAGRATFRGHDLLRLPSHLIARAGIGLVPEGRQIFPTLTVRENLIATAAPSRGPWRLERVHALFPRLAERDRHLGRQLSGGEQQMLAIGRALMTNPALLILDEATEGLAPLIRAEIHACLSRLKAEGLSVLLIDKHVDALLGLADRLVVLERGRTAWTGTPAAFAATPDLRDRYLGA